jgi:uncharacterized OB-fold protein
VAATGTTAVLEGSRCDHCGTVAFPVSGSCSRCGLGGSSTVRLSTEGTVWAYTVQRFPPKSPPYMPPADGFRPFAVGYVELPEGIKVEAVLDCRDFCELDAGVSVSLVATEPVPRFATASHPREA